MRIGIDASNLRDGGGVTHLAQLLEAAEPDAHRFERVVLWSGRRTLDALPARPWLTLSHEADLDGPLPSRLRWQTLRLAALARAQCDVLFVPGGSYVGRFRPFVTMFRNLLPFDARERARFRPRLKYFKLLALRAGQAATFRRAHGLVFLHEHARDLVLDRIGPTRGLSAVIPHGIADRFFSPPRPQEAPERYSGDRPFRWLYVSTVDAYKHHPELVQALASLVREGLPVRLDLVGSGYPPSMRALQRALDDAGSSAAAIRYHGNVAHQRLHEWYHRADAFVFGSTCENMPNVLLEAMAAGLPIASSRAAPMPQLLGDSALLFDPERPASAADAMRTLFRDAGRRVQLSQAAHARAAAAYSWPRTAAETLAFLRRVRDAAADTGGSAA